MIQIAIDAIKKAGELLRHFFPFQQRAILKSERDFVTPLDLASEKIITREIKKKYPGHNIFSEESGLIDHGSDYTWIIDPLCSSNNFVYGLELYGITISLIFEKRPLFGVIYLPQTDSLLTAELNKGAFRNGNRIHVSKRKMLREALILYDNQFYKDERMYRNFLKIVKKSFTIRILGSAAFDLSMVSIGKADVRIFHKTKPCDFLAGALIIEEAGGKVTNFEGEKYSEQDTMIIASNGKIHREILRIIQ